MPNQTFYQILGVQPNASREDIREKFHELARTLATDKNSGAEVKESPTERVIREAKYQELIAAYTVLINPQSRQAYDQQLARAAVPASEEIFLVTPSGTANDEKGSTALVIYQQDSLQVLMDAALMSAGELANKCKVNKELAFTALKNPQLREKLRFSWYEIAKDHPEIIEMLLKYEDVLANLLSYQLKALCNQNKACAEFILQNKSADNLRAGAIEEILQKHQIPIDRLHPSALITYQTYLEVLQFGSLNSELSEEKLPNLFTQLELFDYEYKVLIVKNKKLFPALWRNKESRIILISDKVTEVLDDENLGIICNELEDLPSSFLYTLFCELKKRPKVLELFNDQLKANPKISARLEAYKKLQEIPSEEKAIELSIIKQLIQIANLTRNEIGNLVYYSSSSSLAITFWRDESLRTQVEETKWHLIAKYHEAIAIELCSDPHQLQRTGGYHLKEIARKYKAPCLLILASERRDIFTGEQLSELINTHGNEVLQAVITVGLGQVLYAALKLNAALKKATIINASNKNGVNSNAEKAHVYTELGEVYFQSKKYAEAKIAFNEGIKLGDKFALAKMVQLAHALKDEAALIECAEKYNAPPFRDDQLHTVICYETLLNYGSYFDLRYALSQYYLHDSEAKKDDVTIANLKALQDPKHLFMLLDIIQKYWDGQRQILPIEEQKRRITACPFLSWLSEFDNPVITQQCRYQLWKFYQKHGLKKLAWANCDFANAECQSVSPAEWLEFSVLYANNGYDNRHPTAVFVQLLRYLSYVIDSRKIAPLFGPPHSKEEIMACKENAKIIADNLIESFLKKADINPDKFAAITITLTTFEDFEKYTFIASAYKQAANKISGYSFDAIVTENYKRNAELCKAVDKDVRLQACLGSYILLLKYRDNKTLISTKHLLFLINTAKLSANQIAKYLREAEESCPVVESMYKEKALRSKISLNAWQTIAKKHKVIAAALNNPEDGEEKQKDPALAGAQPARLFWQRNLHDLEQRYSEEFLAFTEFEPEAHEGTNKATELSELQVVPH